MVSLVHGIQGTDLDFSGPHRGLLNSQDTRAALLF
jgi:hypothetical protein